MENSLMEYVWSLALRSPVFLVSVAGLAWAMINWRKSSLAAMLTAGACLLLLLSSCIFPAMFVWITPWMLQNAPPGEERNRIIWTNRGIIGTWNVCTAFELGALIFAVFAGRAAVNARRRYESDDEPPAASSTPSNEPPDERIRSR